MSHLSFLGCEPARCGNWAARGLEFKRTVGVPHGLRKRRGLNATFRPPTVAKLDTPNMTLNLLAAICKQFNWPPTGHVTTQGVREDHTANNTESFTAIKGLAAGRPVLLHVGVVGVISVSKTSGKLYAKVPT